MLYGLLSLALVVFVLLLGYRASKKANLKKCANPDGPGMDDEADFSARELVERLKATQTDPNADRSALIDVALGELLRHRHKFSNDQKTECFDVFDHHLKKCVLSEKTAFDVFSSILGIVALGHAYYQVNETHKEKFINAWPQILLNLKVTLHNPLILQLPIDIYRRAAEIFLLAHIIDTEAETLKKDKAFEVAVVIWNGHLGEQGEDHYSEAPLFVCLLNKANKDGRLSYLKKFYKNDPEVFTNQLLTRLEREVIHTNPVDMERILRIITLLGSEVLVLFRAGSATKTFLSQKAGPSLVSILDAFLDEQFEAEERYSLIAALFCQVISLCIIIGPTHARQAIQAGALQVSLRTKATSRDECGDGPDNVLYALLFRLVHDGVVGALRKKLHDLYSGGSSFKDLPEKKTSSKFRHLWENLEVAALEQTLLLRLFDLGYAPELQTCANHECRKLASRSQFKVCSGCGIAVYCSDSCQTTDWSTHRRWCKQITKEPEEDTPYAPERFTRRTALVHITRHLALIELQVASDPLRVNHSFMGILINYETYPYHVSPFDYRTFLCDDIKSKPTLSTQAIRHAMVANEVSRLKEAQFDCMMVVISIAKSNTPFIFHLSGRGYAEGQSGWAKALLTVPKEVADKGKEMDGLTYELENGLRPLSCHFVDALRAAVGFAHTYATDLKKSIWRNDILDKAAGSVIGEFEELIRETGVGGDNIKAIAVDRAKAYADYIKDDLDDRRARPPHERFFL